MSIVFAKSKKLNDGMKVARALVCVCVFARARASVCVCVCVRARAYFKQPNNLIQRLLAAKGRGVSDNLPTVS